MNFKITITILCLTSSVFSQYIKDENLERLNNILDNLTDFQDMFPLNKDHLSPTPFAARLFKDGEIISPKIIEEIGPAGKTDFSKDTQKVLIYAGLDEKGIVGRRIGLFLLEQGFKVVLVQMPRIDGTHSEGHSYFKRGLASTSHEDNEDEAVVLIDSLLQNYPNFEHHFLLDKGSVEALASQVPNFPPAGTALQDENLNHWRAAGEIASLRLEEIGNKDVGVTLECYSAKCCKTTKMSEIPHSLSYFFNTRRKRIPIFAIGNPLGLTNDGEYAKDWNVVTGTEHHPLVKTIKAINYAPEVVFQTLPKQSTAIAIKSKLIGSEGLTIADYNEYVTILKAFADGLRVSDDVNVRSHGKAITKLLDVQNWVTV